MRVDGSISTLVGGVGTEDEKITDGRYAAVVKNLVCDPRTGLRKRPPLQVIKTTLDEEFPQDSAQIIHFLNQGKGYWLLCVPGQVAKVYDEAGVEYDVLDQTGTLLFEGMTGPNSMAYTAQDEVLFLANKKKYVRKTDKRQSWTTNSHVVFLQAPISFSSITIQWVGGDSVQKTVSYEVPDVNLFNAGTNFLASTIGQLMRDQLYIGDEIVVKGSTIVLLREDGQYGDIAITDGQRDSGVEAINDETDNVLNLPKYASPDSMVRVRPDPTSDRGSYFMKARATVQDTSTPVAVTPIGTMLSGNLVWEAENSLHEGVHDPVRGSGLTQPNPVYVGIWDGGKPTWYPPSGDVYTIQVAGITWTDRYNPNSASFIWGVNEIGTTGTENDLTYITVVERDTGKVIIDNEVTPSMYNPSDIKYILRRIGSSWSFPVKGGVLRPNVYYDVYDSQLADAFGKIPEVTWEECSDPLAAIEIDPKTFVHTLAKVQEATVFTLSPMDGGDKASFQIRDREAGDDDTNPFPDFVDKTINDIGFFQNRLVVLTANSVNMSVTDEPQGWFRETATQQLANDPISIKSNAPNAQGLVYMVNHNNDLLFFGNGAQFKQDGGGGVTSRNAALQQSSSYNCSEYVPPISNGVVVYFGITYSAAYGGVSQFVVDQEADSRSVGQQLTSHCKRYIPRDIFLMVAATTPQQVFVVTAQERNVVYVYQYDDYIPDLAAWSKWELPGNCIIHSMEASETRLLVAACKGPDSDQLQLFEMRYDTNFTIYNNTPSTEVPGIFLDYMTCIHQYPGGYHEFQEWEVIFIDDLRIFQGAGCDNPGKPVPEDEYSLSVLGQAIRLILDAKYIGTDIWYGYNYESLFQPQRKWVRDDGGIVQTHSHLRITDFFFEATGDEIFTTIENAPEGWPYVEHSDNPALLAAGRTTRHRMSFKQRNDEADIVFRHIGGGDFRLIQVEWRGTYYKTGRRF